MMKRSSIVKRTLAFAATIYLAFAILSLDNGLSSRSLQDDEEMSKTPKTQKDILVVTMGQKDAMPVWTERLGHIDASLSLLYASYDEIIEERPKCEFENGLICQTAFIPDTTWTQGRNLLAAEALRMEERRDKEYDYWLFLDDDVDANCDIHNEESNELLGEGSCWQKVFNFIGGDDVPENVSTISLAGHVPQGFEAVTNADAMFAAFKRSHVPYLLPYATLPEGGSQWTSQSVLFCIMETCAANSVGYIPYITGRNGAHRDYVRGLNIHEIRSVIANNYHDEESSFYPCPRGPKQLLNGAGFVGPFETGQELNDHIPPTEFETCAPMKKRFVGWANKVIDDLKAYEAKH